jgi:hypothetical protein
MADYFSNHFANQADATRETNAAVSVTAIETDYRIPAGRSHGRLRTKIAHAQLQMLNSSADTLRMMTFKSNDRLFQLFITSDDVGTTGDIDIGLALAGNRHDGAVVDDDLFSTTALDVNAAALDRVDQFDNGALANIHRGFMMWELLAIGGGTDVVDPHVQYDLILTCTEDFTEALSDIVFEAVYTAGD